MDDIEYGLRTAVADEEVNALHAAAFGHEILAVPWSTRLRDHSVFWVTARRHGNLVGFVNVIGDGGAHAVLLDLCVDPVSQGRGIGQRLVRTAADESARRGCQWLHADYEPPLRTFYEDRCGLRPSPAGLLRLST